MLDFTADFTAKAQRTQRAEKSKNDPLMSPLQKVEINHKERREHKVFHSISL